MCIRDRPTNEETGHIFDLLMAEVRQVLPDSNHEVVLSASDAILEILKEKDLTVGEKKKQIIELIDYQISDVQLNELINLSNRIYDYDIGHVDLENTANDESPDEIVAVEFDMSDDDGEVEEDIPEEIENDHNNIINREEEENDSQALTNEVIIAESTKKEAEDYTLSIKDIDEYFLQRRILKLFDSADAAESLEKAKEVYKIMIDKDVSDRDLENEIMELMDYDHFDFVRLCIENRWKIVYRIQLLQAEDSDGENKLFEEMKKLGLSDLVAEFVEGTQKKRRLSEAEDPTKGKKIKSEKKTSCLLYTSRCV